MLLLMLPPLLPLLMPPLQPVQLSLPLDRVAHQVLNHVPPGGMLPPILLIRAYENGNAPPCSQLNTEPA